MHRGWCRRRDPGRARAVGGMRPGSTECPVGLRRRGGRGRRRGERLVGNPAGGGAPEANASGSGDAGALCRAPERPRRTTRRSHASDARGGPRAGRRAAGRVDSVATRGSLAQNPREEPTFRRSRASSPSVGVAGLFGNASVGFRGGCDLCDGAAVLQFGRSLDSGCGCRCGRAQRRRFSSDCTLELQTHGLLCRNRFTQEPAAQSLIRGTT